VGRETILGEVGVEASDLLTRLERLLGYRTNLTEGVVDAIRRRAAELEDPVLAPAAARSLMGALHPYEDPPRAFWATETGQAVARAIGYHREVAPFLSAAAILNVSRQRVYQLCDLERLVRVDSPREGVSPISLRYELWTHGRRR
jgi:hypothetical protein